MSPSPSELSGHLDADEKMLWSGSPPAGIVLRKTDWAVIPFSIIWLTLVLVGTGAISWFSSSKNQSHTSPVIALLFVSVGVYLVIGRFLWDAFVRSQTLYALTNKRAIILVRGPFRELRSVELTTALKVETEESGNGGGSIWFGQRLQRSSSGRGWPLTSANGVDFMFERISGVRNVVNVVRDIQLRQRS